MKLSISNIGWLAKDDIRVYKLMKDYGFKGLEIAPTRIIKDSPYDHIEEALNWKKELVSDYGFEVPSMQSIWFGRSENIFASTKEHRTLIEYTKKAIDFAEAIGCKNLVFGCPRNRAMQEDADSITGVSFFREIAGYAGKHKCVIGMEANPPIYNTNYINTTAEALELIDTVASDGFGLNLDLGTMIYGEETAELLRGNVDKISHVHISEPKLAAICKRELHKEVIGILHEEGYEGYISIEMGNSNGFDELKKAMEYLAGLVD